MRLFDLVDALMNQEAYRLRGWGLRADDRTEVRLAVKVALERRDFLKALELLGSPAAARSDGDALLTVRFRRSFWSTISSASHRLVGVGDGGVILRFYGLTSGGHQRLSQSFNAGQPTSSAAGFVRTAGLSVIDR